MRHGIAASLFLLILIPMFPGDAAAQAIRCADAVSDVPRTYPAGSPILQLFAADFDGDGHADALARGSKSSIVYGRGDGTFEAPVELTATLITSAAIGDLNADGLPDVLSVEDGDVLVYENRGSRRFAAAVTLRSGPLDRDEIVALRDFTEDGRLDILVGGPAFTTVLPVLLVNDGNFRFSERAASTTPLQAPIAVADFNHDGHLDLAGAGETGAIRYLRGDGQGHFDVVSLPMPVQSNGSRIAADLNGDGRDELVTIASDAIVILYDLLNASTYRRLPGTDRLDVLAADLNGDAANDLLVSAWNPQTLEMHLIAYLNDGHGGFGAATDFAARDRVAGRVNATADFDHDGALDLIAPFGSNYAVYFGRGDGTFRVPRIALPARSSILGKADFDGDGVDELIAGGGSHLYAGTRTGAGTYAFDEIPLNVSPWFAPPLPHYGPMGANGALIGDYALGSFGNELIAGVGTALRVFERDAQHHWSESAVIDTAAPILSLTAIGAGKAAVIVRTNGCNTLRTYDSHGLQQEIALDCSASASVQSADVDRDGRLDLVVAGSGTWALCGFTCGHGYAPLYNGAVLLLRGRADGTFAPAETVLTGLQITSMRMGDFNGDRSLDLAIASLASRTQPARLAVYEGDGAGHFTLSPFQLPVDPLPNSGFYDAGDLNGDGVDDLAVNRGSMVYFFGSSAGLVQNPRTWIPGDGPRIVRNGSSELPSVVYTVAPGEAGLMENACRPTRRRGARH